MADADKKREGKTATGGAGEQPKRESRGAKIMSEDRMNEELVRLGHSKAGLKGRFTISLASFKESVDSLVDIDDAKDKFNVLEQSFTKYHETHMKYVEIATELKDELEINKALKDFDEIETQYKDTRSSLKETIEYLRSQLPDEDSKSLISSIPPSRRSAPSSHSNRSTTSVESI